MRLILPKTFIEESEINRPLFFLAGPIRGGGNWQEKFCMAMAKLILEFFVVVPCRWQPGNNLFCHRVNGTEDKFPRQTAWEHHYLDLTAKKSKTHQGCIVFWLPVESKEQPRDDGQPYARDTYGELGSWRRNLAFDESIRLVVGAEPDFPGLSVIRENFRLDLADNSGFIIYSTMEETVNHAVQWVK